MSKAAETVGFGAPAEFGAHVFVVDIPASRAADVHISEHYGYKGGDNGIPYDEVRVVLSRRVWSGIADSARRDFNERLKAGKLPAGRWTAGETKVDRLLGKELTVLAWAAEVATDEQLPIICRRWSALRPEERWWLFAMTVAEAGLAEDRDRGWRKALQFALSDPGSDSKTMKHRRPVHDRDLPTLPLFGEKK